MTLYPKQMTDKELIHYATQPDASEMEKELAERLEQNDTLGLLSIRRCMDSHKIDVEELGELLDVVCGNTQGIIKMLLLLDRYSLSPKDVINKIIEV